MNYRKRIADDILRYMSVCPNCKQQVEFICEGVEY